MANGSVNIPGLTDYLPLSGGTITGGLIVQDGIRGTLSGDVTGNLTGNVTGDLKGSATKWNGRTLRLNNNTSDTYLLLLSGNNVDYITKDQLLSSLTTRVATCEQQVKAIGQTTEVLLRTSAYSVTTKQIYNNNALTYTFGSMASDVQFVKFGQSSSKLLRGSSQMVYVNVYESANGVWTSFGCTLTFNQNGTFTITDHNKILRSNYYEKSDTSGFSGTLYQYKYAT